MHIKKKECDNHINTVPKNVPSFYERQKKKDIDEYLSNFNDPLVRFRSDTYRLCGKCANHDFRELPSCPKITISPWMNSSVC